MSPGNVNDRLLWRYYYTASTKKVTGEVLAEGPGGTVRARALIGSGTSVTLVTNKRFV